MGDETATKNLILDELHKENPDYEYIAELRASLRAMHRPEETKEKEQEERFNLEQKADEVSPDISGKKEEFYTYASGFRRFWAFMIDITILGLPLVFIGEAIIPTLFLDVSKVILRSISITVYLLIGWIYYSSMESSDLRGTVGKVFIGLKVGDMEGKKIDRQRASQRYFLKAVSALPFLLGFLTIPFNRRKQGLHDKLAQTLVFQPCDE